MFSRQYEQLARQRTTERTSRATVAGPPRNSVIRHNAGWALVAIGLRIAESGDR
ncbi:MAG TPA: hypothetical protein VFQ44_11420 [Streptosporangiaceae bacterium]|nr:hypothetical protein [Streptosporangiaceae bacterium]